MKNKRAKNKFSEIDLAHMETVLKLVSSSPRTSPNPRVAVLVARGKKVLSKGYHRGAGLPHAEIEALRRLKFKAKGATLYVSLEPCCHIEKRTPPCVDAIAKSGISRVVIATKDPNPQVNGKGIRQLRARGLLVEEGCLAEKAQEVTRAYQKWIQTQAPYVYLKSAASLDGKLATASGESHWITSEASRKELHHLRAQVDAILVGYNTVVQDNPQLTARGVRGKNPIRILLDSHLRLREGLQVFQNLDQAPTWVAALEQEKENPRRRFLESRGVECIWCPPNVQGRVDLDFLLKELGRRGVCSLLVEAGAVLGSAFVKEGLFDEWWLFLAPKVLGGEGLDLLKELKVERLPEAPQFEIFELKSFGPDLRVRLKPKQSR